MALVQLNRSRLHQPAFVFTCQANPRAARGWHSLTKIAAAMDSLLSGRAVLTRQIRGGGVFGGAPASEEMLHAWDSGIAKVSHSARTIVEGMAAHVEVGALLIPLVLPPLHPSSN